MLDAQRDELLTPLVSGLRSLLFYVAPLHDRVDSSIDDFLESVRALTATRLLRMLTATVPAGSIPLSSAGELLRWSTAFQTRVLQYSEKRFGEHWNQFGGILRRVADSANARMQQVGARNAILAEVPAALASSAADTVTIDKIYYASLDASKREIVLIPSYLNWPQVLIKDEGDPVCIHYSLRLSADALATSRMVTSQISALSRTHSLQLLHEVAKRPLASGALATRLNVAPATISRTLSALEAAGFVTVDVRGRERIYHLNYEKLESLSRDLYQVVFR